jgi:hypothetical protein
MSELYAITIVNRAPDEAWKALNHLQFNLHWSRMFYTVGVNDQGTIQLYGNWKTYLRDMKNFSTYYPHAHFEVKSWAKDDDSDITIHLFNNGNILEEGSA